MNLGLNNFLNDLNNLDNLRHFLENGSDWDKRIDHAITDDFISDIFGSYGVPVDPLHHGFTGYDQNIDRMYTGTGFIAAALVGLVAAPVTVPVLVTTGIVTIAGLI